MSDAVPCLPVYRHTDSEVCRETQPQLGGGGGHWHCKTQVNPTEASSSPSQKQLYWKDSSVFQSRVWNQWFLRTPFHRQNVCLEQKATDSTRIVNRLLGRKSQIISLISPCVFGLAVSHRSHDCVGRVQRRRSLAPPAPPSMDCHHSSSPENSWPFNVVLYRTTTLDTHPQNVCWLFILNVSHHAKSS